MTEENKRKKLTLNRVKVEKSTISNKRGGSAVKVERKKRVVISDKKADELRKILENAKSLEAKATEEKKQAEELRKKREELLTQQKSEEEEQKQKLAEKKKAELESKKQKEERAKKNKQDLDFKDDKKEKSKKSNDDEKRRKKLTIKDVSFYENEDGFDDEEQLQNLAAFKKAREKEKKKHSEELKTSTEKISREVTLPETITVKELAVRMSEKSSDVIKKLMEMGLMVTINEVIDADTAELIATEFGHNVSRVSDSDIEEDIRLDVDKDKDLKPRAPVVTVMGHVDHGKTSLLDALRETDVVSREAGGITQHVGAYQINLKNGKKITFLDTPGHEAFSEMRARGANATDIVVLVVAANDSIMPQTIEAINHSKAAGVPIIVAINKIDLPDADPNKVKTDLLQHEVVVEGMGGDALCVEISAKKRMNLEKLEEVILLQAEMLDLKANPNRSAEGVVVEAQIEKGRGAVATVLVQKGNLQIGDVFVSGNTHGKIRAMFDDKGRSVKEALPSTPVVVLGYNDSASAGDDFIVTQNETKAKQVADYRHKKAMEKLLVKKKKTTMEEVFDNIQMGEKAVLPVIIKADVQGSSEALTSTLEKIDTDKGKVSIIHTGVGGINESDVTLARASNAVIIGFNVRAGAKALEIAKRDNIDIRYYSVIYNVTDDVKNLLSGLIAPEIKENFIGYADVSDVFKVGSGLKAAGCKVTQGIIKKGCKVRIIRDDVVVHEGTLSQLKRFKDDVKEVREGMECGLSFENYNDLQVKDKIECFEEEEIKVTI